MHPDFDRGRGGGERWRDGQGDAGVTDRRDAFRERIVAVKDTSFMAN